MISIIRIMEMCLQTISSLLLSLSWFYMFSNTSVYYNNYMILRYTKDVSTPINGDWF